MIVKNKTNAKIIHDNVYYAKNLWDKGLGLIIKNQPMLFNTRFGIHTFFLKKPIDIIILDSNLVVKKIKLNLIPCRLFFWNINYPFCLEFPQNTLNKDAVRLGDQLIFVS